MVGEGGFTIIGPIEDVKRISWSRKRIWSIERCEARACGLSRLRRRMTDSGYGQIVELQRCGRVDAWITISR